MTSASEPRFFAIVPAAGRSTRMGVPKLLLPWGDGTVLRATLNAWNLAGCIDRVFVVLHPEDESLHAMCAANGARPIVPAVAPPDMKASVLCGLDAAERELQPTARDAWFLAPADFPQLSPLVVNRIAAEYRRLIGLGKPIVPRYEGRRGHPVLFPWQAAAWIRQLGLGLGVNAVLTVENTLYCDVENPAVLGEMNTPDEFAKLRQSFPES